MLNRYGSSLTGHGLYEEAYAYLERVPNIREEVLEERNVDASTSLLDLGILLQLQGHDEEARQYLERALAVHRDVCGSGHPATALVRENLTLLDA